MMGCTATRRSLVTLSALPAMRFAFSLMPRSSTSCASRPLRMRSIWGRLASRYWAVPSSRLMSPCIRMMTRIWKTAETTRARAMAVPTM